MQRSLFGILIFSSVEQWSWICVMCKSSDSKLFYMRFILLNGSRYLFTSWGWILYQISFRPWLFLRKQNSMHQLSFNSKDCYMQHVSMSLVFVKKLHPYKFWTWSSVYWNYKCVAYLSLSMILITCTVFQVIN